MSNEQSARRRRRLLGRSLRLRTRIIIGVGAVALVLSTGLGVVTYFTVRSNLLSERQTTAVNQVAVNARLLSGALRSEGVDETELLGSLRPQVRSRPLLQHNGEWFAGSLQIQPDELPASLLQPVLQGEAARQRFSLNNEVVLGVGTPLSNDEGVYFEVFALGELNKTLRTLRDTLAAAGAAATAVGLGLGSWIARRATAPLTEVSGAAELIADGHLDTRLDASADRDLQQLTTSFNQMADSLKDRIDQERRFASDVSHELRSPLTTLLTSVAVLENRRHELSPDGQEALELLSADINRFQRMVADLIEIAKHDAGIAEVSWSYIRAPDFVLSALRRLHADDVAIDVAAPAEAAVIRVDERRLERSLANLIENATHHADGATGVTVEADDDHVWIAVEDRGPGVPQPERIKIFERFSRGAQSRRRANIDGSGLGLALAAEDLAVLGGRIWVEARPAGGARFVIELLRVDS